MKFVITKNEFVATANLITNVMTNIDTTSKVAGVISTFTDDLKDMTNFPTAEKVAEMNETYTGIVTTTVTDTELVIEVNEEIVIDSINLASDFISDMFDVIRYGVKTVIAFGAVKVTAFKGKINDIVKKAKTNTAKAEEK